MPRTALSAAVFKRAERLGFTKPYITDFSALSPDQSERLSKYVDQNYHGTMTWMEDTLKRRAHPQALWPLARSAIILGMNYSPDCDPMETLNKPDIGTISVYARNRDYHDILKGRLKEIAGLVARDTGADVKIFVDTAPLMEKPLAHSSGLGWQGKHTNLVSREHGSWLFLGTILTAAMLTPTEAEIDHCGSCRACLDICPTDAFPAPYQLDARRCISYLTIEHKGPVDLELREKMGNRIYGCDDCLAVCPWNKFAQQAQEAKLQAREDLNAPKLSELAALTDKSFRTKFAGSPIKRIGRNQFIRNVLYAMGNSGTEDLLPSVRQHLTSDNPVIIDAALWAQKKLSGAENDI